MIQLWGLTNSLLGFLRPFNGTVNTESSSSGNGYFNPITEATGDVASTVKWGTIGIGLVVAYLVFSKFK
jgi:hypothetical protein